MNLDWGPDARARIVVDPKGQLVVTFGTFQDKNFNGRAYFARSSDGASFTQPRPLTTGRDQPALRGRGHRSRRAACSRPGSTSATSPRRAPPAAPIRARRWPMPGRTATQVSATPSIALDNTCECCRLGLAFAGAGRPAVVFRNIFPGSVRDHGVITFRDPDDTGTGAPRQRRRLEDRGLPASRARLAIAPDGSYHVAWFTDGAARKGLFYARADSATRPTPSRGRCRPPIASPRGPTFWPTARRCTWCGRNSMATRWRCAGR